MQIHSKSPFFLHEFRILRLKHKPQRRFNLSLFFQGGSFGVQLLMHLLPLCLLLPIGKRPPLDKRIFFLIKHLPLNVLVTGERKVLLTHRLLQDSPILLTLIKNRVLLPSPITSKAGKISHKIRTGTSPASGGIRRKVLLTVMLASNLIERYLQGARQADTSKSFLLTSQYIPHYYGLVGTNRKALHGHYLQEVLNFFPKKLSLCPVRKCPQKHLECFPKRAH